MQVDGHVLTALTSTIFESNKRLAEFYPDTLLTPGTLCDEHAYCDFCAGNLVCEAANCDAADAMDSLGSLTGTCNDNCAYFNGIAPQPTFPMRTYDLRL